MNGFAGGIVGGAVVRLFLDSSQFNTAFKTAEANAKTSSTRMEGSFSKVGVAANAAFMLAQAAVVTFVAAGVKAALEYEKAFQRIDAISNASAEDLSNWKNALVGISDDTARPVNELADALYFLSSSGLDAAQVLPVLEASAQAAAVGLGSTADIAKITSQALNAYAASGLTAAQVTDTLVAAVREGSADPEEFADALGRILPAAAAAGIGFDEVTASLAALSNIGLDVNEGVTAMRGLFLALIAPTAKSAEAMANLGISTQEMRDTLSNGGVIAALNLLQKATGGNLDKMKAIIPNVRALTGALGLTGQEAQKVSDIFLNTMDSTGALQKALEETAKGPAFQLEQSFNQLRNAGMEVGMKLIPSLVMLGKVIGVVADNFQLLLAVMLLMRGTTALTAMFTSASIALAGMGASAAGAATTMGLAANATLALGTALKVAFPVLIALTAAYMAFKALAGPGKEERMTTAVESGLTRIKQLAAEGKDSMAEIDKLSDAYASTLGNMTGMGTVILTPEDEKKIAAYRALLITTAAETKAAMETAALSVSAFVRAGGASMRSLEPLTRLTGMSFRDMATEIKAALENTEDRTKAFEAVMTEWQGKATEAIDEWRTATADALDFVAGRFDELAGEGVGSISKIITELEKSYTAQLRFNENLVTIADRAKQYGIDASAMLQTLIDQGPAAADTVAAIASSGEENFRRVNDLLAQGRTNARSTAADLQAQVLGVLKSIEDILSRIARKFGITLAVDVKDNELDALIQKLRWFGVDTTTASRIVRMQREYGDKLATGGVIAAANGIVSSPTYLVGEGSYGTRFGTGAELVQPLNEQMLSRLGAAIGQYSVKVSGPSGGNTTIVNVDAAISPMDVAQNIEWWRRTQGR